MGVDPGGWGLDGSLEEDLIEKRSEMRPRDSESFPYSCRAEATLVAVSDHLTCKDWVDLGYVVLIEDEELRTRIIKYAEVDGRSLFDKPYPRNGFVDDDEFELDENGEEPLEWWRYDDLARRNCHIPVRDAPEVLEPSQVYDYVPVRYLREERC